MAQTNQKIRLMVQTSLPHRPPAEGCLFVGAKCRQRTRPGPQTLLSLLNSGEEFLPFEGSDGLMKLLSRRHVQWVLAESGIEQDLLLAPVAAVTREELVRVRLEDGTEASGLLVLELPDEKSRASDFMNGPRDFFTLSTPHGLLFVNKHAVLEMIVFETSPLPSVVAA